MQLAWREIRRAKLRFALLTGAVALLVFLVLFLQTLQVGLITSFIGAIRNNSAPVFVYSVDGRRNLQGGVVLPELEAKIRAIDGVARAGRIGQATFSVETSDKDSSEPLVTDAAILGYETEGLGSPGKLSAGRYPTGPNEAVATSSDEALGFGIGQRVRVLPSDMEITVVGQAVDAQLNVNPVLYVDYPTYKAAVAARNPDGRDPLPNAIAVEPSKGIAASELVKRINAADDDLDALTRADAAAKAPGVSQVQLSFRIIFLLLAVVIPFVTGLFFLILTLQKANSLTLLRAIGAPAWRLVTALLVQVAFVSVLGVLVGTALYSFAVSGGSEGGVTLSYQGGAVVFWSILIIGFSLLSALVSARRVLSIDPVAATTGVAR